QPAAAEPVANERERDHRPEHGRDETREERDLDAEDDRVPQPRIPEWVRPVAEREALPREVETAGRVVERERDHDRDRQEEVAEGEQRVDVQEVAADGEKGPK